MNIEIKDNKVKAKILLSGIHGQRGQVKWLDAETFFKIKKNHMVDFADAPIKKELRPDYQTKEMNPQRTTKRGRPRKKTA